MPPSIAAIPSPRKPPESRGPGGFDRYAARRLRLETAYERFHHPRHLGSDPLCVLYRFADPLDREVVGLVAACLAYGNVKAILGGIERVLGRMGPAPRRYVAETPAERIRRHFRGFRYRVTPGEQMAGLLVGVRAMLARHGSLRAAFLAHTAPADATTLPALAGWVDELADAAGVPLDHLVPHPRRGSACKRLHLYLRWMVRRDAIDPGGWGNGAPKDGTAAVCPSRLIVPLDTHLHRVARKLRLTRRRGANLATAVEVTEALRRVRPDDPLRYDFALTRPGILRENDE